MREDENDAIKGALREAGEAVRKSLVKPPCCMEGTGCELPPCHCSQVAAAAAVAAFLRALPSDVTQEGRAFWCQVPAHESTRLWLAAAVVRAAPGARRMTAAPKRATAPPAPADTAPARPPARSARR